MNKTRFGNWEAITLLVIIINTQIVLGFPRIMVETAGTAAWIVVLYVSILAFLLFAVISRLYAPFERKDLLDLAEFIGGKYLRIFIGFLYFSYITAFVVIFLREFGEDLKIVGFRESPLSFLLLFFIVGMFAAVYIGLEGIARISAIALPVIILGFLIITVGVAPFYQLFNVLPVLGSGLSHIFVGGFLKLSIFSALSILFFIYPFLHSYSDFKKVGFASLALSSFFFFWSVLTFLLAFPYPTALESYLPIYQMTTLINYGRFFQRIDSVFMFVWVGTALIYLSVTFFFVLHIFKKAFQLKYYKPIVPAYTLLILTASFLPPNLIAAVEIETQYFRNYIWILTFPLPILLLLAARRKMNSGRMKGNEK